MRLLVEWRISKDTLNRFVLFGESLSFILVTVPICSFSCSAFVVMLLTTHLTCEVVVPCSPLLLHIFQLILAFYLYLIRSSASTWIQMCKYGRTDITVRIPSAVIWRCFWSVCTVATTRSGQDKGCLNGDLPSRPYCAISVMTWSRAGCSL